MRGFARLKPGSSTRLGKMISTTNTATSPQIMEASQMRRDLADSAPTIFESNEQSGATSKKQEAPENDHAAFEAEVKKTLGEEFDSEQEDAVIPGQPYLQSFDCPDLLY